MQSGGDAAVVDRVPPGHGDGLEAVEFVAFVLGLRPVEELSRASCAVCGGPRSWWDHSTVWRGPSSGAYSRRAGPVADPAVWGVLSRERPTSETVGLSQTMMLSEVRPVPRFRCGGWRSPAP